MSISEILSLPTTWTTIIALIAAAFLYRRKNKAEADDKEIDVRIKEKKYEADRYSKLFDRVRAQDEKIEKYTAELEKLRQENREIRAELNMYKTIQL